MAADTAVVGAAGMAVLPGGMEEAVIQVAVAGMAVAVTGTVVTGTVGVVAGIMVVTVVVGELAPQIGLGVGLGLLGGALATAPYYGGYDYSYDYAPYAGTPAPTIWYWCDAYQGYYPSVPECPVPWRQVARDGWAGPRPLRGGVRRLIQLFRLDPVGSRYGDVPDEQNAPQAACTLA